MEDEFYNAIEIEEDTEEETVTLDLEKGTAYSVDSNVLLNESNTVVESDTLSENRISIPQACPYSVEKYSNFFIEKLISKAVASYISLLKEQEAQAVELSSNLPYEIEDEVAQNLSETYSKKINKLRKVIRNGSVYYEAIEPWIDSYIQDYLNDSLMNLIELKD